MKCKPSTAYRTRPAIERSQSRGSLTERRPSVPWTAGHRAAVLPALLVFCVLQGWSLAEQTWFPVGGADFVLQIEWQAASNEPAPSRLVLSSKEGTDQAILQVLPERVELSASTPDGKAKVLGSAPIPATIKRHDAWIAVRNSSLTAAIDGTRCFSASVRLGLDPQWRWEEGKSCRLVARPRVQRTSQIVLADDFMREGDKGRLWEPLGGNWAIQSAKTPSQAANAFRLFGKSPVPAVTASQLSFWFWRDYRAGVAVRSADPSATMGLVFYFRDARNYHLLRWVERSRLELVRVRGDREEVLATSPAVGVTDSWYRLEVMVSGGAVGGYLDGTRLLLAEDDALVGGKVGLMVASEHGCWFDDVAVESVEGEPPAQLARPFGPAESSNADFSGKDFTEDNAMVGWAHPRGQWDEGKDGYFWYHCRFFNDTSFEWQSADAPLATGEVVLFADQGGPETGYALRWNATVATLSRKGKLLRNVPAPAGGVSSLQFSAVKTELALRLNQLPIVRVTDQKPLSRGFVGAKLSPVVEPRWRHYKRYRMRPDWRDRARVSSSHHAEYLFDSAPTAWLAQAGHWRTLNRWACVPMWSFFGGRANEMAVLWNKRRVPGDFDLEVAFAPMEGSVQRVHYTWPTNLSIAFCADGRSLDRGYNLLFGLNDIPSRLYRGSRVVAENSSLVVPGFRFNAHPFYRAVTRNWQRIRLRRSGGAIRVSAAVFDEEGDESGMKQLFEFTDPQPLKGDRFGLWAWGLNGMAVARLSLSFEASPGSAPAPKTAMGRARSPEPLGAFNQASGGALRCLIQSGPIEPAAQGLLRFQYRLESGLNLGLFVRRRMELAQFVLCGDESYRLGAIPLGRLQTHVDGEWHELAVDLRTALASACPDDPGRSIDEIFIASPLRTIEEIAGLGVNRAGASYEVREIRIEEAKSELPPSPLPPPQVRVYGRRPLDDFESDRGEWLTFGGPEGALLWRDPASAKEGRFGLRLFNAKVAGPAGAQITSTPFDARLFRRLRFDYRFPRDHELNLIVRSGPRWFEIKATGMDATWPVLGSLAGIRADDAWRTTEFDLASALARHTWGGGELRVDALYLADSMRMGNIQGLVYWIDNFCLVPAVPSERATEFTLSLPGRPVTAYSHVFDDRPDTEPPARASGQGPVLKASVPASARWLHVKVQAPEGEWSPVTHLPLVVATVPDAKPLAATQAPAVPKGPPPAPRIAYLPSDRLCFNGFEWKDKEGLDGTMGGFAIRRAAWVLPCLDDGATGDGCVELVNLFPDDFFSVFLHQGEYDLRRYPRVAFDYKLETPDLSFDITGLLNKEMVAVEWLWRAGNEGYFGPFIVGRLDPAIQDGQWHKEGFDLLKMVEDSGRSRDPALPLIVDQLNTWAMNLNPVGPGFKIDNFMIYSPKGRDPAFEWKVPGHAGRKLSYAFCLDQKPGTSPPEERPIEEHRASFRDLGPGTWYFHVRARNADGQWGPPGHLGFEIAE